MSDDTVHSRPLPKRPATGLLAWQATVGYIASEYSPDAILTIRVVPGDGVPLWGASVRWADVTETVEGLATLPVALRALWRQVDDQHKIFRSLEAAAKRPADYRDSEWLDEPTVTTLDRMLDVTAAAFGDDWQFLLIYQPDPDPTARVQARLIAKASSIHVGGRGANVREACRDLYHNAAPGYFANRSDSILGA